MYHSNVQASLFKYINRFDDQKNITFLSHEQIKLIGFWGAFLSYNKV